MSTLPTLSTGAVWPIDLIHADVLTSCGTCGSQGTSYVSIRMSVPGRGDIHSRLFMCDSCAMSNVATVAMAERALDAASMTVISDSGWTPVKSFGSARSTH